MASERCIHGLLPGMCSICLRREKEIKEAMENKQKAEKAARK